MTSFRHDMHPGCCNPYKKEYDFGTFLPMEKYVQ